MKTTEDRAEFFSTLFPKNYFSDLVRKQAEGTEKERHEAYKQYRTHLMGPAIYSIIMLMAKAGDLAPIEGIEGHDIWVVNAWNNVASGVFGTGGPHGIDFVKQVAEKIDHALLFGPVYAAQKLIDKGVEIEQAISDAYQALVTRVAGGNLTEFMDEIRDNICSVDDIRYNLRLTNWRPSLWYFDQEAKQDRPIAPLAAQEIQHLEFECKTGNLLVTDAFDLEAIEEYFDEPYSLPSINSVVGSVRSTERHLAKGMVHVHTTNGFPSILQNETGEIIVADIDPDAADETEILGLEKCRVSTDVWAISIIERERVEAIVAERSGCSLAEAHQIVGDYVADRGIGQIKVSPGRKHLYFSGDYEQFQSGFHSPDLPLSASIAPLLIISDRKLELVPKPGPAPAVEPDDALEMSM